MPKEKSLSTLTIDGVIMDCQNVIMPTPKKMEDGTDFYDNIEILMIVTRDKYISLSKKKSKSLISGELNYKSKRAKGFLMLDGVVWDNGSDSSIMKVIMFRNEENIMAFRD